MQAEGDTHKDKDELRHPFASEFSEKDLAALVEQISPKGIEIPDDIQSAVKSVLDGGEVKNVVPEQEKWEALKAVKEAMESGFIEEAKPAINSNETKKALGNEVIYALNYLLEAMQEEDVILDEALKTEDTTGEPVQVQIMNNIMSALKIPNMPLGEIEELHEQFQARDKSVDFNYTINDRMADYMHLFEDNLAMQIKEAHRRSAGNLAARRGESDDVVEVYGREADYWATMTPEKLYKYLVRRIILENMSEGRITFEKVREIAQKLYKMKHKNPEFSAE